MIGTYASARWDGEGEFESQDSEVSNIRDWRALETKQAGSISGGEGVMSFFCRKSKDEHGGEGGRWQPLGDAIPTLGHFGEEFQGKYV